MIFASLIVSIGLLPTPSRIDTVSTTSLSMASILGNSAVYTVPAQQGPRRVTGRGHPRLSPFRDIRRTADGGLEVQIDDATWSGLVSIEGIQTPDLIEKSKGVCGRRWYERLREDLVEVLTVLGKNVGDGEVDLELQDLASGKVTQHDGVAMSHDKRQRLVKRDDDVEKAPIPRQLKAPAAHADLRQLESLLTDHYSYLTRPGHDVDLDAIVTAAIQAIGDETVSRDRLARAVDKILRAFGDGHTRLRSDLRPRHRTPPPFLVDRVDGGHVAFTPDRRGFLDPQRPFLLAIDRKPLADWLAASSTMHATAGSNAMRARGAVRGLRNLGDLRAELGVPMADRVFVTVASTAAGEDSREVELDERGARRPVYGRWPRTERHTILPGNIGYLRIAEMSGSMDVLDELDDAMQRFRKTDGLVIDVRSNGGGTRDVLRRLFPYFMSAREAPFVANVAAIRIPPAQRDAKTPADGYLTNRALYPARWHGWSKAQKKSVRAAARRFRPEWQPGPKRAFSDWHFFVLSRSDNTGAYSYDHPVVILIDDGCFSATDIFLGAFKGRRGITLLGIATMGGSGRSRRYRLDHSQLEFQASSMVSCRPNGRLYEGRGIAPDLRVERVPTDFLHDGSDTQLQAALDRLLK